MTAAQITSHDIVTFGDLKLLAGAKGPCVTIIIPISGPLELSRQLKNAIRTIEKQLKEKEMESSAIEFLLGPVRELAGRVETAKLWSNALIVFRAPEVFHYFLLYRPVPELETVAERFQVRALFAALAREQRFHLLGVSQRHIQLWHCTHHRAEAANLGSTVPRDIRVWLNTRQPDHDLNNRAAAGPVGSMKGVVSGTSTDRERKREYLAHFFKEVDKGINILLRNDPARLLIAGVETEVALYRQVSTYPRLFDKAVTGSPDGLPASELHKRAMDVVIESRSEPLEQALANLEKHRDRNRISLDPREAIKAACEGRAADLFLSEAAEQRGVWNEETHEIESNNTGEDLLNAAGLQTVLHGGRVFELEPKDMPVPRQVAAVLRF